MGSRSKITTAGPLFWTPAPTRTSPSSSEEEWADEDDDKAEKDEEFLSQMDENGIIGLREALEDMELRESPWDVGSDHNPDDGGLTPEETYPARHDGVELDVPPEELSGLQDSEPLYVHSPDEDAQSLYGHRTGGLKERAEDEEESQREEGEERLAESSIAREEGCCLRPIGNIFSPTSRSPSPVQASVFPHLLHFSAEEVADVPRIEAEQFPESSVTESLPESRRCTSHDPHPHFLHEPKGESKKGRSFLPVAVSSRGLSSGPSGGTEKPNNHPKRSAPSQGKTKQRSPEDTYSRTRSLGKVRAGPSKSSRQTMGPQRDTEVSHKATSRTPAAEMDESRNGPLHYSTPDFSKVEPRIHFPKSGYKPPESKGAPKKEPSSARTPFVFKSPAGIVKEVLLSSTGRPPPSSDPNSPPSSAPSSTVPEDFRCPRQASTLVEQLQEDYNRLLTKYAEAENTIDRLRLEAKVNLYADPPKSSHSVQSAATRQISKFLTLNFPQAQRAEINPSSASLTGHDSHQRDASARPSSSTSVSSRRSLDSQIVDTLYKRADKFLQQLQTFEDLLKSQKLKPFEQIKGLSQLVEDLNSLERGYLMVRDEHKGTKISQFDPNRELEGFIFQCGMHVEELKEEVEEMQQDQPTCEALPSPPPHPTPLSVPTVGREPTPRPESPPLPVTSGVMAGVEVSSASAESDGEEVAMEDEEALSLVFLDPVNHRNKLSERDFSTFPDHYQSFKELPTLFQQCLREGENIMKHEEEQKREQHQRNGNMEVQNGLPQRKVKSHHQDSPGPTSKSDPLLPNISKHFPGIPSYPPAGTKSHSSSMSSLGENAESERRRYKLQPGCQRVLSQDGIVSPETDSGFMGSECSRLTPAAGPSSLHQRESASISVPQVENPGQLQTSPAPGAPPSISSPPHRRSFMEHSSGSQFGHEQGQKRSGRGTSDCRSSQRRANQKARRAESATSEFELESDDTYTVSEERHQYVESTNPPHSYRPGPSHAAPHHHGDPLRAPSSSQWANHNEAIQWMLTEISRLTERLENLRSREHLRASAQRIHAHPNTHTPCIRLEERWSDVSRGRRKRWPDEEEEECVVMPEQRKRSTSARRQKAEPHITTDLEPDPFRPQLQISRQTQTPRAERKSSATAQSRTSPARQHPGLSVGADELDGGNGASASPQCSSHHRGRSRGRDRESTCTSSQSVHCAACRRTNMIRITSSQPVCWREFDSAHISRQPDASPDRAAMLGLASVPLLQCVPLCPSPLLLYPGAAMTTSGGVSSGFRGCEDTGGRALSDDEDHRVKGSLKRAIRAARHMKHTSRHMARSLATGLQYHQLLNRPWIH
ncbi:hypothetical protein LDENG_00151170 [Lucifuga dentata]|nr:hypothetical protein LDENG_00151170 [Lucifuga dentata]